MIALSLNYSDYQVVFIEASLAYQLFINREMRQYFKAAAQYIQHVFTAAVSVNDVHWLSLVQIVIQYFRF